MIAWVLESSHADHDCSSHSYNQENGMKSTLAGSRVCSILWYHEDAPSHIRHILSQGFLKLGEHIDKEMPRPDLLTEYLRPWPLSQPQIRPEGSYFLHIRFNGDCSYPINQHSISSS